MKRKIFARTLGPLIGVVILASAVACGGGSEASTATNTPVPATSTSVPTATTVPATQTPVPSPTAMTAGPTATTASGAADAGLIAQGKDLFDNTAGGIGCAYCHTKEATGDTAIGSPDVRGATEAQISDALVTRALMTFITMTDQEIKAVAAYLKTLQP